MPELWPGYDMARSVFHRDAHGSSWESGGVTQRSTDRADYGSDSCSALIHSSATSCAMLVRPSDPEIFHPPAQGTEKHGRKIGALALQVCK
jgi:hypothetical protein